jgi:hypothetical protein
MRLAVLPLAAAALLTGCQESTAGDNVREAYDNKAAAIDQQAEAQPNPAAKEIYRARADAIREEGRDREKGLEGGEPSSGPTAGATGGGGGK